MKKLLLILLIAISLFAVTKQERKSYVDNITQVNRQEGTGLGVFTGLNGSGQYDDLEFWSWKFDNKYAKEFLNTPLYKKKWKEMEFKTVEAYNTSTHEHWILNVKTDKIKYKKK